MKNEKDNVMDNMENQVTAMENRLKQWAGKVGEFVARAEGTVADAQADYRVGIDDLKTKYQVAQAKLKELRSAGANWEILKEGMDSAWNELDGAFKKLTHLARG